MTFHSFAAAGFAAWPCRGAVSLRLIFYNDTGLKQNSDDESIAVRPRKNIFARYCFLPNIRLGSADFVQIRFDLEVCPCEKSLLKPGCVNVFLSRTGFNADIRFVIGHG